VSTVLTHSCDVGLPVSPPSLWHCRRMTAGMRRMRDGCAPYIFWHRIRPFLSGWRSNPTLPNGVVYEGVRVNRYPVPSDHADAESRASAAGVAYQLYGGSAAQSSVVPCLDAFLGVQHADPSQFLRAMREYMPPAHRRFIAAMEARPSVRDAVAAVSSRCGACRVSRAAIASTAHCSSCCCSFLGGGGGGGAGSVGTRLSEAFSRCVDALAAFRAVHISVVKDYILKQVDSGAGGAAAGTAAGAAAAAGASAGAGAGAGGGGGGGDSGGGGGDGAGVRDTAGGLGTGGTELLSFLEPLRTETKAAKKSAWSMAPVT
jgi:hypothetical protein